MNRFFLPHLIFILASQVGAVTLLAGPGPKGNLVAQSRVEDKYSESSGAAAGHKRQEITSTALNVSGDHVIKMCPSDRSPVKTASTRWPSGQGHWNQRVLCTLVTLDHPPSGISIGQAST